MIKIRKKISEKNIFPNFDLYNEYHKIDMLLSEKKTVGVVNKVGRVIHDYFTLEEYIEYVCFNNWNLRGTFISIDDMRQGLGIEKSSFTPNDINEKHVLEFLQYAINCVNRVSTTIKSSKASLLSDDTIILLLWDNITLLVEKLNCTLELDKKNQEIFISYNNSTATTVSTDYPDIKDSISEYIRIDNRGDLKRKGEILCTLFKKLESVETKLKANNFGAIASDATFLFNKSGIRHWVEQDKIACETFLQMNETELEVWYDKTFNLFLTCMVLAKYTDNMQDIKNLKRTIGE